MELVETLVSMLLAFGCAYSAGKAKAMLDFASIENKPTDWTMVILWIASIAASTYFIVSIYGQGVARGLA